MAYVYKIHGVTLNMDDMLKVSQAYEAACTAEFIIDNPQDFGTISDAEALEIGYEVRRRMDKVGSDDIYDEIAFIQDVIKERNKL